MESYEKRRFLDPKEVYAQLQRLHDKPSWQEEQYQCGDSAYERMEITLNAMACIDMLLFKIEEQKKQIQELKKRNNYLQRKTKDQRELIEAYKTGVRWEKRT